MPIPAGIGFTGRWEEGILQPVTDISRKLRAAREAGIFILVACAEQGEIDVIRQSGLEPGVKLVLLRAGSSLNDVITHVNTVCHDLGLTEYRWRRAVEDWEERVVGRRDEATLNRLLPSATNEKTCPVGFVGRESLLSELDRRKRNERSGHLALVGSPRSGKTTTLSQWIFRRSGAWPRPPLWFSFLRGMVGARTVRDLETALTHQARARYCILELETLTKMARRMRPVSSSC